MFFEPNCEASGCWVVDVIFTIGNKGFNTFYLPQAVGNDELSYDFDYDEEDDETWDRTPWSTFFPADFPCRTLDYDPNEYHPFKPVSAPAKVTSCCLPEMMDMYRPIQSFVDVMSLVVDKDDCFDKGIVPVFALDTAPRRRRCPSRMLELPRTAPSTRTSRCSRTRQPNATPRLGPSKS